MKSSQRLPLHTERYMLVDLTNDSAILFVLPTCYVNMIINRSIAFP